jgi:hypothetical protein
MDRAEGIAPANIVRYNGTMPTFNRTRNVGCGGA